MTQPAKALLVIDTPVGFYDLSLGSRNNASTKLNAIRLDRHSRSMGRQVVIIRHDSPDPDEKGRLRDQYRAVVSSSTISKTKARPAQLKPGLY